MLLSRIIPPQRQRKSLALTPDWPEMCTSPARSRVKGGGGFRARDSQNLAAMGLCRKGNGHCPV